MTESSEFTVKITPDTVQAGVEAMKTALDTRCSSCLRLKATPEDWASRRPHPSDSTTCWEATGDCVRPSLPTQRLGLLLLVALDAMKDTE